MAKQRTRSSRTDDETVDTEETDETTDDEKSEDEYTELEEGERTAPLSDTGEETTEPVASEEAAAFAGGDVDLANVEAKSYEGEVGPVILEGYWVRLKGSDDLDERYHGHIAEIVRSPWQPAPIGVPDSGIAGYVYDEDDENYIVQTRDTANALLTVPFDGFSEWGQSRVDIESHG